MESVKSAKVALLNNRKANIGAGRYVFTLARYLEPYQRIDHYFFDYENLLLEVLGNSNDKETITKLNKSHICDNALFSKMRLSKILCDARLAACVPADYDIYHFAGISSTQMVKNIPVKAKKVITIHDLFLMTWSENVFEKVLSKRLIYGGTQYADRCIVISEYTKQDLLKHFKNIPEESVHVVHLGVDKAFRKMPDTEYLDMYSKLNISHEDSLLLHISIPARRKNNILLINLLNELINNRGIRDLHLLKLGIWDVTAKKLLEKYNLNKYIVNLERVSESEMPKVYNMADLFLFPSYGEGFGLPVLEAMSSGTPVIASNKTALPEVVGNAGILLDPDDTAGFADNVTQLINDDSLYRYYQKRGYERSKLFTWEETAKKTNKIYLSLLE